MHQSLTIFCLVQLSIVASVEGVSMTIVPSSILAGSNSTNPVPRLQLKCFSNGTNNIETVYRLEISRKRSSDPDYAIIAAVDDYKTTTSFTLDMRSPNATGRLVRVAAGEPPTSGILIVTMDGGGLTCKDQAEFKCTMTYKMMGATNTTSPVSDSNNFTVITPPNDVRVVDARYEEGGIQLELTNDIRLKVGTRIMYRCTANIGDDFSVAILWERTSLISTNFSTYTPTVPTDIVQDPVTATNCSFRRTSSMYYNLTSEDDDDITFRCKVRAYLGGQWYESTSAHHRAFVVHIPSKYSTVTTKSLIAASISGGNRLNDLNSTWTVLGIILSVYQYHFIHRRFCP
ncbi:hypothetical protein CHS0354_040460 [Potamilus streckersoni]|uniref:Ig-like domain-containing protein n=1 Tax=Potamilus streckersoni TaxID=2493646 RepID=A0AAE0SZY2_9BIVA|nr:hypothetical protein CHS0354_040460 [Potamilus streckersoni]